MRRYYQIRDKYDKPVSPRLYASLHEASAALVRRHASDCQLVELDNPAGAVAQRFTFDDCEEIMRKSRETT